MSTIVKLLVLLTIVALTNSLVNYRNTLASPICTYGRLQSPINLLDYYSKFNSTISLVYEDYLQIPNARLVFTNSTLEVVSTTAPTNQLPNYGMVGLDRNGVYKRFILRRILIFFPGQHVIESVPTDLEIQLVHDQDLSYTSPVNNMRYLADTNTKLTISLLYRRTAIANDNGLINNLVNTWTGFNNAGNVLNLDLINYGLYKDRPFFFYEGSEMTAPCNENTDYVVINDVFNVPLQTYSTLNTIFNSVFTAGTSKPISPLYGRPVYRNYANYTEIQKLNSSYIGVSFFLILVVFGLLF